MSGAPARGRRHSLAWIALSLSALGLGAVLWFAGRPPVPPGVIAAAAHTRHGAEPWHGVVRAHGALPLGAEKMPKVF